MSFIEDSEDLEDGIATLIDIAGLSIDKMIEAAIPEKVAKLSLAYKTAFIREGFARDEVSRFVEAILRSNSFGGKSN